MTILENARTKSLTFSYNESWREIKLNVSFINFTRIAPDLLFFTWAAYALRRPDYDVSWYLLSQPLKSPFARRGEESERCCCSRVLERPQETFSHGLPHLISHHLHVRIIFLPFGHYFPTWWLFWLWLRPSRSDGVLDQYNSKLSYIVHTTNMMLWIYQHLSQCEFCRRFVDGVEAALQWAHSAGILWF